MLWSNYLQSTLAHKALGRASYDERKHPRHPKGTKGGGKFAPKGGTLAETVGQVRFNPKRVETDLGDDPLRSVMFERSGSVMVLFNPKTQELLFGVGLLKPKDGFTRTVHDVHSHVLMDALHQAGVDPKTIERRSVDEVDNWVRGKFFLAPSGWWLELNTSYAAGTRFDRATNRWEEHPDESMMNISDALATLRAQGFPKELPVEIWKGVPGRRGFGNINTSLAEKTYDAAAHPRVPAGNPNGGQFAPAGGGYTSPIEFTYDSPVAQRARAGRAFSAPLIFRPSTGALMADDRAEHADLISEDGGRTDEYVRGRAMYAPATGKWLFDFNFYYAGAPLHDRYTQTWSTDTELATANIAAAMRRLSEAGFPPDSDVRIQRNGGEVSRLTLGDVTAKFLRAGGPHWDFPLVGLLRKAGAYDETKHPRYPAGDERGGQFAPKGGGSNDAGAPSDTDASEPANVQQAIQQVGASIVPQFRGVTMAQQGYILTPQGNIIELKIRNRFDMPHEMFARAYYGGTDTSEEFGDGEVFELLDEKFISISAQKEFACNVAVGNRDGLAYLRAAVERSPEYKKYSLQVFAAADYNDDILDVSRDDFLAAIDRLYEKW